MRKLAVEQDAAIVAVTHDEKIFDRFDRLFQLRDGRLAGDRSQQNGAAVTSSG
jgi:putative ABC transport system ATP-binding protein